MSWRRGVGESESAPATWRRPKENVVDLKAGTKIRFSNGSGPAPAAVDFATP